MAEATTETTAAKPAKKCREKGCKRPYRAKGLCNVHYKLWRQGKYGSKQRYKTCSKEGCRAKAVRHGLCETHLKAASEAAAS